MTHLPGGGPLPHTPEGSRWKKSVCWFPSGPSWTCFPFSGGTAHPPFLEKREGLGVCAPGWQPPTPRALGTHLPLLSDEDPGPPPHDPSSEASTTCLSKGSLSSVGLRPAAWALALYSGRQQAPLPVAALCSLSLVIS